MQIFRGLPAVPGAGELGVPGRRVWVGDGPDFTFVTGVIADRWRDMELVTLTAGLGRYFGTDEGLLVVRAPSVDDVGLEDGDVILEIGGRRPTSPEHAMRILASFVPGETLELSILRRERRETLEYGIPRASDRTPTLQ